MLLSHDIMVGAELTREMIDAGARLLQQFDRRRVAVTSALWLLMPDIHRWRLMLGMPSVHNDGPIKSYQKTQRVIASLPPDVPGLTLNDITIMDPNRGLPAVLRSSVKVRDRPVRLTNHSIKGHFIEDALVYR